MFIQLIVENTKVNTLRGYVTTQGPQVRKHGFGGLQKYPLPHLGRGTRSDPRAVQFHAPPSSKSFVLDSFKTHHQTNPCLNQSWTNEALMSMAQVVGTSSCNWKDCRFDSWSGTCLGCRFDPLSGCVQEATNQCFSLTLIPLGLPLCLSSVSLSLSLSLPPLYLKSIGVS